MLDEHCTVVIPVQAIRVAGTFAKMQAIPTDTLS